MDWNIKYGQNSTQEISVHVSELPKWTHLRNRNRRPAPTPWHSSRYLLWGSCGSEISHLMQMWITWFQIYVTDDIRLYFFVRGFFASILLRFTPIVECSFGSFILFLGNISFYSCISTLLKIDVWVVSSWAPLQMGFQEFLSLPDVFLKVW